MPRQPIRAKARARKTHNRIYKVWQSGACDICVNRSTTTLYRRISSISSIRTTVYGTSYKVITTLPCLTVPAEEEKPIGIWGGQRRLRYIKKERKTLYTELLTSGRLNAYLANIAEQVEEQMFLLTKQMAEREGVTEQLKAHNQMMWIQRMKYPGQGNGNREQRSYLCIKHGGEVRISLPIFSGFLSHSQYPRPNKWSDPEYSPGRLPRRS